MHVIIYLITPIHLLASLAAVQALHGDRPVGITLAVHWPGAQDAHVAALHAVVSEMISGLSLVTTCVPIPGDALDRLAGSPDVPAAAAKLRQLLGRDEFDEIYYSHDVIGAFYAMLAQSYPSARRICFGDGLGIVYERRVHLGLLGIEIAKSLGELAQLPFGTGVPQPHQAALVLPVDQSGHFLDHVPLHAVPRAIVRDLVEQISANCKALQCHIDELLARSGAGPKFLLMTENNAEGNFMSFERDVEMYCAVVRKYCPSGSVIYLKSHPGEALPRNDGIRRTLGSEFEVHELDDRFKRYPVEFMGGLVRACKPICMSYPTLSLKYLFDVDVIQPTDDAFIEAWYPEEYWKSYKNGLSLYREPLEKLSAWDGRSLLWSGADTCEDNGSNTASSEENRNLASPFDFRRFIEALSAVLEIGCSDGGHVPGLVAECRIGRYLGIDIDAGCIAVAGKIPVQGDIRFLQANLLDEDVLQGRYDAIFAHDVFAILDFPAKEKMLQVLYRHLAAGGAIVLNEFNHRVLIGNAMANLLRGNLRRTFYFLRCYAVWAKAKLLGRERPIVEPYRFAGELWYRDIATKLRAEIVWRRGEGLFLDGRTARYFQRIADRLVPGQRDLVILRHP